MNFSKLIQVSKAILPLFLILVFFSQESNAQSKSFKENAFKIIKTAGVTNLSAYEKALNVPDIESFRYRTKRNTIEFDNGFTVELLSAQELFIKGEIIEPNNYSDTRDKRYIQPIFHLADNGSLIALHSKILK